MLLNGYNRIFVLCSVLLLLLSSCASYNRQAAGYYSQLRAGNYEAAQKELAKTKLLKKKRNQLLFNLEMGKVAHLRGQWEESNRYFNEADLQMEDARTTAGDIALGNLLNPMMQTYRAEDFEKYLVHYYKAINYLQLGLTDEAMVEARRITLRTQTQQDKTGNKDKYSEDAFSLSIQALIYEASGDINNAFIACRNAVDVYLENKGSYYGVQLPEQLKKDVIRLAQQNGFSDEADRYQRLLGIDAVAAAPEVPGGELILFWENGSAPVKAQEDIWFSLIKGNGGMFFTDAGGLYNIPFDNSYNSNGAKLEDLRSFRVALPKYVTQPPAYSGAQAQLNGQTWRLEAAENVNALAFATLRERMLRELSSTLTRLAIKKLAEAAVRPNKSDKNDKNKSEEEKKKDKKKENTREAMALALQLFNAASEKADTRNWQSLPHTIYYTRIPLQKGENTISLQLQGRGTSSVNITVNGRGGIQFRNVCSIN